MTSQGRCHGLQQLIDASLRQFLTVGHRLSIRKDVVVQRVGTLCHSFLPCRGDGRGQIVPDPRLCEISG